MPILYNADTRTFRIDAGNSSYAFCIDSHEALIHLYYGPRISDTDLSGLEFSLGLASFSPNPPDGAGSPFTYDSALQEYPVNGTGDYRLAALSIRGENGSTATCLRYHSHTIRQGKYALDGLPAVYATDSEASTLDILMEDPLTGAEVHLLYGVLEGYSAITRAAIIRNGGKAPFFIEKAASAAVDFNRMDFDLIHLYGQWSQERQISRSPLTHDIRSIASKRGSSSHNHNPFAALAGAYTDENRGDAYGFSLIYSGNFAIETECDAYDATRLVMGINPIDFEWTLAPGEIFTVPEAVLVYSQEGLGGMSRTFHQLYRRHLCRGEWKEKIRPILVNNWEATYFDFNEEKLYAIAKDAAELGIEMLVMDDGWFGKRDNDRCSLGDWFVNEQKLKGGLNALVDRINGLGLKFGIWFEPEMISPDSDLYRTHPEWTLCAPGRDPSIARTQYVLDMTRKDVQDYLFDTISSILSSANIAYVKWDFNRNLTEAASAALPPERRKETFHRYVLGLYSLLERLTSAYPHILFEGCSGGGGRFDPAMLYYSPQIWTSDDTDAMERCRIQYGTSMVYPPSSISAHVSAVPNHQTKRITSFETRGNVAMAGAFGYELDLTKLTAEEKELVKKQVAQYHAYAPLVQDGDFYRLISPFADENRCAWMSVSADKSEALVTFVVPRTRVNFTSYLRLAGLDPQRYYQDDLTGAVRSGALLMNAGINLSRRWEDGESVLIHLKEVQK
ncbi:MAG: alpha-galactosidase [Candidatus Merdivicinus sp.]